MQPCPGCGSADISDDLLVFADKALYGDHPVHVGMIEPEPEHMPFIWSPKTVVAGFRAAVCGNCGYTRLYTNVMLSCWKRIAKGSARRNTPPEL
jgi:predicted nucleic-acid-binding Zn-ribbon protein